jgi:hypothetical protein
MQYSVSKVLPSLQLVIVNQGSSYSKGNVQQTSQQLVIRYEDDELTSNGQESENFVPRFSLYDSVSTEK